VDEIGDRVGDTLAGAEDIVVGALTGDFEQAGEGLIDVFTLGGKEELLGGAADVEDIVVETLEDVTGAEDFAEAAKLEEEIRQLEDEQRSIDLQRIRRAQAREAAVKSAQITNQAVQTGLASSSIEQGAQNVLQAQLGQLSGQLSQEATLQQEISDLGAEADLARTRGELQQGRFNFGLQAVQSLATL
jgi:uncharacterized protein YyaL (SSP411 family)